MLGRITRNNPYTEGEIVAAAWICIERTQFLVDSMKNRLDVVSDCLGDQDGEFISSKPRKDVGLPERVLQHRGSVHQDAVSFLVAEGVVDPFQTVEIDKCEQERFPGSVSQLRVMFG